MEIHSIRGSGKFNLEVQSWDCKNLIITDFSEWNTTAPYTIPKDFEIEIKPPAGPLWKAKVIPGKAVEVITGDKYISDGIYCFTAEIAEYKHHIYRPILCRLYCCQRQYLSRLLNKEINAEELMKIERYKSLIELLCHNGEVQTAMDTFALAYKEIKFLNCNCH